MNTLRAMGHYLRDLGRLCGLSVRLLHRLHGPGRARLSPLAKAVEGRLLAVLGRYSRQPRQFRITGHQRLDPLDLHHGTWAIELESTRTFGLPLETGDMLHLLWENRPETVRDILDLICAGGEEAVRLPAWSNLYQPRLPEASTLGHALRYRLDCEMASAKLLHWAGLRDQARHNEAQEEAHEAYHAKVLASLDWSLPHPDWKPRQYFCPDVIAHGMARGRPAPSPQDLVAMLDPAGGRSYTIAGSTRTSTGRVRVSINVSQIFRQVESPRGTRAILPGRASHFLLGLEPGKHVRGWILPDSHHLGHAVAGGRPCIAICTGSGISGVLSGLRSPAWVRAKSLWLVYGVRSWKHKSLFGPELEDWCRRGAIARMDVAVSRPVEAEARSRHVQEVLWEERAEVARCLREGWAVFVCGGQTMGEQVRELMKRILVDQGLSGEEGSAEALLRQWEASLRYQASISGI